MNVKYLVCLGLVISLLRMYLKKVSGAEVT